MTKRNLPAGKAVKIIYWVATIWHSLGMLSTGIVQLLKLKEEVATGFFFAMSGAILSPIDGGDSTKEFFWAGIIANTDYLILVFQTCGQKNNFNKLIV